jgi:hypothetical protein
MTYQIQQSTEYQFETIENGECDTLDEAQHLMAELVNNLGWTNLRIIDAGGSVVAESANA